MVDAVSEISDPCVEEITAQLRSLPDLSSGGIINVHKQNRQDKRRMVSLYLSNIRCLQLLERGVPPMDIAGQTGRPLRAVEYFQRTFVSPQRRHIRNTNRAANYMTIRASIEGSPPDKDGFFKAALAWLQIKRPGAPAGAPALHKIRTLRADQKAQLRRYIYAACDSLRGPIQRPQTAALALRLKFLLYSWMTPGPQLRRMEIKDPPSSLQTEGGQTRTPLDQQGTIAQQIDRRLAELPNLTNNRQTSKHLLGVTCFQSDLQILTMLDTNIAPELIRGTAERSIEHIKNLQRRFRTPTLEFINGNLDSWIDVQDRALAKSPPAFRRKMLDCLRCPEPSRPGSSGVRALSNIQNLSDVRRAQLQEFIDSVCSDVRSLRTLREMRAAIRHLLVRAKFLIYQWLTRTSGSDHGSPPSGQAQVTPPARELNVRFMERTCPESAERENYAGERQLRAWIDGNPDYMDPPDKIFDINEVQICDAISQPTRKTVLEILTKYAAVFSGIK